MMICDTTGFHNKLQKCYPIDEEGHVNHEVVTFFHNNHPITEEEYAKQLNQVQNTRHKWGFK